MGGIGSYVRQCAAALAQADQDVHVFTLAVPPEVRADAPPGVHLHDIPDPARRILDGTLPPVLASALTAAGDGAYRLSLACLLSAEVLKLHREKPFDIVESPDVENLGLPLMLNSSFSAPVITHLHCCTAIGHMANEVPVGPTERLRLALEFAGIHLADSICAPTRNIIEETRKFLPVAEPATVIPYPFVCTGAGFSPPQADGPMVFLGRIERRKGVHLIADALNVVLKERAGATFRFVGPDTSTGPGGSSMCQYIRSRLAPDIASRVHFTGELSRPEIEKELLAARFCVLPSLWENFPLACCEAFAAGRTAIVASGTGSVELVADAGMVAERDAVESIASAMLRLTGGPKLLHDLSRRAYDRIRQMSDPVRVAQQRVDYFRHVIDSWNGRANLSAKLQTLPADCIASVLPAFAALVSQVSGSECGLEEVTPGRRLLSIMDDLQRQSRRPAQVLLYGAGRHTARLLSERALWESRGHRVVGLIDDHPRFAVEPKHLDLPVQSLRSATNSSMPVVLSTDTYQDQFWQQTAALRERGVPVFRLYPAH